DRWLALGLTLMLFASIHLVFSPLAGTVLVAQGDFLRLLAYCVLLVGVWRAIRSTEFRRAVAEGRARVAREIHDGLAQYLFAVTTHVSMLEVGADTKETLPRLKEAALAAQQEAGLAVLALSPASGSAPFDAALRRYVDFLTADGGLEVELEIDAGVQLAPDEQIEVFRIVQEGLSNTRRHAGARKAWLTIARRGVDRLVALNDDGHGFESPTDGAGQGLRNMRQRAAAIGGAFSLRSVPGRGTALEVVLRPEDRCPGAGMRSRRIIRSPWRPTTCRSRGGTTSSSGSATPSRPRTGTSTPSASTSSPTPARRRASAIAPRTSCGRARSASP